MGQSQKWRWSDRRCCWTGHWPKDRSLNYWLGRNRRSGWIPTRDPNRLMHPHPHPHPMPSTGRCWSHVRRDLGCWWSGKILHRPSRRTSGRVRRRPPAMSKCWSARQASPEPRRRGAQWKHSGRRPTPRFPDSRRWSHPGRFANPPALRAAATRRLSSQPGSRVWPSARVGWWRVGMLRSRHGA